MAKKKLPDLLALGVALSDAEAAARHRQAWFSPHRDHEATLKALSKAIGGAAALIYNATDEGADGVMSPAVGQMLEGYVQLLNGERDRFDGGVLHRWACITGAAVGYCLEHSQMAWSCCTIDGLRTRYDLS